MKSKILVWSIIGVVLSVAVIGSILLATVFERLVGPFLGWIILIICGVAIGIAFGVYRFFTQKPKI